MTARRRATIAAALAAACAVAVFALATSGTGQESAAPAQPIPELGVADAQMTLMGSASDGTAWGYRLLPLEVPPPVVDGKPLEFAPPSDPASPDRQLAFLRYAEATGWQIVDTPARDDGSPFRGGLPNALTARITPEGGGLLIVRDPEREQDEQVTVLIRDPSEGFGVLAPPPSGILLPEDVSGPAEAFAEDRGSGRAVVAAVDEGGHTGAFFAPVGRDAEEAVVHFDGVDWSREPIDIPDRQPDDTFRIVAIGAAAADNAWLLAELDERHGRGVALFRRDTSGSSPEWVEVPLGAALFEDLETPARGVTDVAAFGGTAQPLTVTADGVWIDGTLTVDTEQRDFTLFFAAGPGEVTGSWCDGDDSVGDALCKFPLGSRFSRREGYRSFAWAGGGFGTRVVTNPLRPGGDDESNLGTYLTLDGTAFVRRPGAGGSRRASGAFSSSSEGWLEGPVHISNRPRPARLRSWPVSLRAPLNSIVHQPGAPPADLGSQALAAGPDGAVARFLPGSGWRREFLLTSSGTVARATLRGVAWPEPTRAHAVGDLGAMWEWRADTGLWEKDPAAPIGYEANLMDIAFQPGDPQRGYAVGKGGALLRYDKTWTQEALPAGHEGSDLTQIAFAGNQALVAAGTDLLLNDGSGWRVDEDVRRLLAQLQPGVPRLFAVGGLPDGGAVVAGNGFVLERDASASAWRFSDQPLIDSTVIAAAPYRADGDSRVRAVVSVVPRVPYPVGDVLPPPDPNVPPPIIPPFALPGDGYLLRETAAGWRDEQNTAFLPSVVDRPIKSDPVLDLDLDARGEGWAAGGWSGEADSAGRGSSGRNPRGRADRQRVATAGIYRYSQGEPAGPPAEAAAEVPLPAGPFRFAVAGHAQCETECADLSSQGIAPDRTAASAIQKVAALARRPEGPRFLLYTGGRTPNPADAPQPAREAERFASLLGAEPSLPVFAALSSGDSAGATATSFAGAFASFPAPFGSREVGGIAPAGGGAASGGARTHYAFDAAGSGGSLRVIVIDNSRGSLVKSDPYQNPAEPQGPWLQGQLADAKARGLPAVVMGSRDLNSRFRPRLNVAEDADEVAKMLVDGGASAYFFERPEENRVYRIPSGAATTIPAFGSGTLGYRSPLSGVIQADQPDSLFGETGFLLVEADLTKRDPGTNRVPVTARLTPIVDDLSLQAIDGTLLRRSRVALFQGLGRRPRSGDRWGPPAGADGNPSPPGGDAYVAFPPDLCLIAGCDTRLTPEYEFASSAPDVGDFVKQDPNSTNVRKPLIGADDKPITDHTSGLFCAFNAGTTIVTVKSGGLSYSQEVTILPGSVQRPCGTRPLDPSRIPPRPPTATPAAPPAAPPAGGDDPPVEFSPPPPPEAPVREEPAEPEPRPERRAEPRPEPALPPPPTFPVDPLPPGAVNDSASRTPSSPPPTAPTPPRPIPPGGSVARVYQVEERREEELATEESMAYASYSVDDAVPPERYLIGLVLLAAIAGASIAASSARWRGSSRRAAPAEARARCTTYQSYDRRRRR